VKTLKKPTYVATSKGLLSKKEYYLLAEKSPFI
jgi:hypothetical protein